MTSTGERADQFPAIEKKHGKPMSHWFSMLKKLGDAKYADQLALLQEQGFSRAHANAVVMHHRGSASSRRHDSVDDLLESLPTEHADLIRRIFAAIMKKNPRLELVVAWNQPMLKLGKEYVIGVSASKKHLTIGPLGRRTHRGVRFGTGRLRIEQEDLQGSPRLEGRCGVAESSRSVSPGRDHVTRIHVRRDSPT